MAAGIPRSSIEPFPFLKLPSELQLRVLDLFPFDEISRCRLICKSIDVTCQQLLNTGYHRVERYHARSLQRVKAQLPRRESERRTHELARHTDILTSVETRLSLLAMTYGKYMDNTLCCFIPGKVLDEMFRVLRIVNNTPKGTQPLRPHELLQELRDISSMAMEHFEEHVVPSLRDRINLSPSAASHPAAASLSTSALVLYAAAAGNATLLNLASLSPLRGPKNGACAIPGMSRQSDSNRRSRVQWHLGCSSSQATSIDHQHQNHRYETLKRQHQQQRSELAVYKRELTQLRTTQQRQKEKMTELERRLNEHEQRFVDILAQLRNSSLVAANTGNSGVVTGAGQGNSSGFSGKRKRIVQGNEGHVINQLLSTSKAHIGGSQKRQKMDNEPVAKK